MDPEIRQQLEEIHALAKDNHRMLRAIRRGQWFNFFSSVVFWLAVLVIPLYLYQQYLAPTISKISEVTGVSTTTTSSFLGLPTFTEIGNLVNSFEAKL
jgi:Ca2+/Na+ antiporter